MVGSDWFRQFYFRGPSVQDTTYLPIGLLIYYTLVNMLGHAYVNTSNLNLKRKSFIKSNSTDMRDFLLVLAFAPIFYFISTLVVLRFPLQSAQHLEPRSMWECFRFNLFVWQTAYFGGLQFTHFDSGFMQGFVLKTEAIRKWGLKLWLVAAGVALLLLGVIGYLVWAYYQAGCLLGYGIWVLSISLVFALVTVVLRKTHTVHIHHYTVGMLIVAVVGYSSVAAALVQGFANGMMIEGGARWGYDDIWVKIKRAQVLPDSENVSQHTLVEISPK